MKKIFKAILAIGIIGAMDSELETLLAAMTEKKQETLYGLTFTTGTLDGCAVVLVKAGIGKVNAARCTQLLIDRFSPSAIVNTGIAGGLAPGLSVGDVVVAAGVLQHDFDVTAFGHAKGYLCTGGDDTAATVFPADEALSGCFAAAAQAILGEGHVHRGLIATGDQFISSESYVKELQTKFDALACEMEGASVARVCDQFGMPCAILRCMSDKADGIAHDTYAFNYTEASNTSASVVQEMMKTLSTTLPFTDVKNTDWCFSEVARVYADGIMGGTSNTTFSPAGTLTRGQVVAMLYRMAGSPAVTANTTGFSDVDNGAYYADAVKWASGKEIVGGYADGTFAPNRAITREQLAAILYRYAKANGADISVGEDTNLLSYKDFQSVGQYAVPALQWAVGSGLIGGTTNAMLSPKGTATRAQAAVILVRFVGMTAAK